MSGFPPTRPRGSFADSLLSRRHFLGSLLAGALGAKASLAANAGAAAGPTLGFNTYGMKTLTTEEALRELAKIGFDSVQLDCSVGCDADLPKMTPARRTEIRKLAEASDLKLTALQGMRSPSADDRRHEADLERLKALAELAHDLWPEQPLLIEAGLGGREPWEKAKALFVPRVADWVKVADRSDVTIVVKPHRDTSMDRPEQAVELFQALGTPRRLRMSFDYSHFALRDMPPADAIRTALPWTGFVAIKDVATENGKAVFKLPGETKQIDYAALIRQFHEGGYRGDYSCEISAMIFTKPGFDCLAAARTSYANLAPAFVSARVKRVRRAAGKN
ncbi:MAG TPA: sugar phosphate isomerase/epimerase family protein [Chthoniobacteraceae bacterium]|jgi:inosose dehydratase|nr:sugar phosphate isomerase/epimerase family protein [Chthoniobacteraceae bacterium]